MAASTSGRSWGRSSRVAGRWVRRVPGSADTELVALGVGHHDVVAVEPLDDRGAGGGRAGRPRTARGPTAAPAGRRRSPGRRVRPVLGHLRLGHRQDGDAAARRRPGRGSTRRRRARPRARRSGRATPRGWRRAGAAARPRSRAPASRTGPSVAASAQSNVRSMRAVAIAPTVRRGCDSPAGRAPARRAGPSGRADGDHGCYGPGRWGTQRCAGTAGRAPSPWRTWGCVARPRPVRGGSLRKSVRSRVLAAAVLAVGLVGGSAVPADAAPAAPEAPAAADAASQTSVSGYIVTLEPGAGDVTSVARSTLRRARPGATPLDVWGAALRGFAAELTEAQARRWRPTRPWRTSSRTSRCRPPPRSRTPPWGLDRIDQRDLPLSTTYTYTATGAGRDAPTSSTPASGSPTPTSAAGPRRGFDAIDDGTAPTTATATAPTWPAPIGGTTYGVAKGVTLHRRARPRLQRQRHHVRRHRRHRLGRPRHHAAARGGQHEPRRRRQHRASTRRSRASINAGVTVRGRRRQRATPTPATRRRPASPRPSPWPPRTSTDARAVVLQLRHLRRPLRARARHHLGLVHQRHGDQHDQRHVDGLAARGRRGRRCSRPPRPPRRRRSAAR